MEAGDKERRRRRGEDDDKDSDHSREDPAPLWQDELGLPIMHWEALSLRIAELEKQEEEKKDKLAKNAASLERGRAPVSCADAESWDDGRRRHRHHLERPDDDLHVSALGSRLQTQMNLQLCFINNSESEDEDGDREERDAAAAAVTESVVTCRKTSTPAPKSEKSKSRGFRNTWRKLRERLRADHKPANPSPADPPVHGLLDRGDVHKLSLGELRAQRSFLAQSVQELSSDLVARLQLRDQLRTEQDAMLLELQDLTSLGSPPGAHG
ncbi:schwannomin-interacting protein 1 [Corythoichthys intestinalis]|uniref:schwannomin-interacting protein 1 n=1 Tax=Corythoichthys intestinalis TaxID=161448 RepID=UPI0025A508A4|nr:schwannomin-interacting protein 1 [Corythoichthys intestinalis]XP_057711904.1 schwannomin-interacting protein 1 [Corythoichthys intestinalis]